MLNPAGTRQGMKRAAIAVMATALAVTAVSVATRNEGKADASSAHAKNVTLFIGDGMGLAHRNAIRLATVGESGSLAMDSMPFTGLIHTSSTTPVTDSAAAATAFASGIKTYNGAIGMDPDKNSVKTIMEFA